MKNEQKWSKSIQPKPEKTDKVEQKKFFKIVVRKLPAGDYSEQDFANSVDSVCEALCIPRTVVEIFHFIEGKIR